MFTPSNMLQKYLSVQPRDMYDIVGALMGYINADPYFKTNEFDEAVKYVLRNGVSENELFQSFDSELDFKTDESKWDEDYYAYSRVYLKDNFCKERIEHVKAIAHKLKPTPAVRVSEPVRTVPVNVQEVKRTENKVQNVRPVQNTSGGQQSAGKKHQDHQANPTTYQKHVGMKGLVMCVVIVLMVVLAFIILR